MKKFIGVLSVLAMSVGVVSVQAQDRGKLADRMEAAAAVVHEVMATPDHSIPQSILAGASCV
ncbi:MAG: hypothetical protein WB439_17120, partial [Acidobacteriaceae bacterium]